MKLLCAVLAAALVSAAFSSAATTPAATPPPRPPLLAVGTLAPNFTAVDAGGRNVRLSDFHGKVVLIDFWSTWCGPCKAAMPHIERIHQRFKVRGLVVLGVCVWDDRAKFNAWMVDPEVGTSYLKVFDPAGRDLGHDIAHGLYHVSGIPTFYLVGKSGTILFAGVGALPATEQSLDQALARAGFRD